jgi:gliding motility-associated-like protein
MMTGLALSGLSPIFIDHITLSTGIPDDRMKPFKLLPSLFLCAVFGCIQASAQLIITTNTDATALAQKLVGEGVLISNATLTNNFISTGFFNNIAGTTIGIDSGIVLTNGRAKSVSSSLVGLDGDGIRPANSVRADANLGLPGDVDLANELGVPFGQLHDAIALEFDFIPLGDSIKFNYILSSEEYTQSTVCVFNDAFGFFISGPGITGVKNIALIPGTNTPVTITNVNNITTAGCVNNPQYYVDNTTNVFFTHEGHTTLFTAVSQVQPCQRYHLKLVVADLGDHAWDTGVFLEAGSLRSDPVKIQGSTPLNNQNLPYFAEGCVSGSIHILRNQKKPYPQTFTLTYGGTATNGVDVNLLPASVTIPVNDSVVIIPITAIADYIPEGIEVLKIYIGNNCSSIYSDSINIEIRDVDLLPMLPAGNITTCRNSTVQLSAASGYQKYNWTNGATLSDNTISNPIATPVAATTKYICTANTGDCIAEDSIVVDWKTIALASKTDILCKNGTNGAIKVTGTNWDNPQYALNNGPYQAGNSFSGLPVGNYWIRLLDNSGCTDSIPVALVQAFPDLSLTATPTPASCSATPDGKIDVTASGGNGTYSYSIDGINYLNTHLLTVPEGTYDVFVKDGNGCQASIPSIVVIKINSVVVDAGPDSHQFCEGASYTLPATSNATTVTWTPATALSNASTLNPVANPSSDIKYYITATTGTCSRTDSIQLFVLKAPVANAGNDIDICYGISARLNGSGGTSFQWSSDPTFVSSTTIADPIVRPGVTTSYFLQVTDDNGCVSLQPDEVKVLVTPTVKIFAGRDTIIGINQPLQLHAIDVNNSGVTKWEWSSTAFLDNPFIADPVAQFPTPVSTFPYEYVYTVTGTTPAGCQSFAEVRIKVYQGPDIYVPTAFTPNRDGRNDVLMPVPVGIKELHFFRVYNRWGQPIFQTKVSSAGWDGTFGGHEQATGVYVWIAEGIDFAGKTISKKGTVTLIR